MDSVKSSILCSISSPIEARRHDGRGEPWAVSRHDWHLNNRQQRLLGLLPESGSRAVVRKNSVSMSDLAALTAKTKAEFAMFTCGPKRLIVRGDEQRVYIEAAELDELSALGYRWSGHTHVGFSLCASPGDKNVLRRFNQNLSVIYNEEGIFNRFDKYY